MPNQPAIDAQPIIEIEKRLSLPPNFLVSLYQHEDDWSFVIKLHAFLEATLTYLLASYLKSQDLVPVFARLETSNIRTGKLAFVKAFDLLSKPARRFVHELSELRNELVHEIANVEFTFETYLAGLTDRERQEFIGAYNYAFSELANADERPSDLAAHTPIDQLVLSAPRLALVAGAARIAVDIYFKGEETTTPAQVVRLLGERVIEEWRKIQASG